MTKPRLAAHVGYLFTELPLADRFVAARDAGFAAADLSNVASFPLADIVAGMRRSGLPFVQTTTAFGARGDVGMAAIPGREEEFLASCHAVLPAAEATGFRYVHVNSGVRPAHAPFEACYATYVSNLLRALDIFSPRGLRLLIEPINKTDVRDYFMTDLSLARRVLGEIAHPDLQILFDVYHLAMEGLDPVQAMRESLPQIGHLQLADAPGRHEPGTGGIDFVGLYATAAEIGYRGWMSAEYIPAAETGAGLGWIRGLV